MVIEQITSFAQSNPRESIILFAAIVSLFVSIVNFFVLDKDSMRKSKARQKEIQKEMKEHQKAGNTDKMTELRDELLQNTLATLKHSFKPMLITIIPLFIFIIFIKDIYAGTPIESSWIFWYIGAAIVSALIFRKLLRLP